MMRVASVVGSQIERPAYIRGDDPGCLPDSHHGVGNADLVALIRWFPPGVWTQSRPFSSGDRSSAGCRQGYLSNKDPFRRATAQ